MCLFIGNFDECLHSLVQFLDNKTFQQWNSLINAIRKSEGWYGWIGDNRGKKGTNISREYSDNSITQMKSIY